MASMRITSRYPMFTAARPYTGLADSELSAMADLRMPFGSESLVVHLEKIYQQYNGSTVLRITIVEQHARERICVAGKAGIIRICEACYRLGANIDADRLVGQAFTYAIGNLNARCQRLEYLLRTGRACPRNRARAENCLRYQDVLCLEDIELLRDRESFSDLYSATIQKLRKLVKDEIDRANHRVEEFNALRKHYEDGGRRDLVVLMQENAKAARKAGFEEGVTSAEESQQIYDELAKIDRPCQNRETLRESKEFWEGVDRKLSPMPASQRMEDPPEGITTGPEENCTDVVQTQTSAEIHLHNPVCDRKSGRKALSPLKKGLGQLVTGYEKLSLRFTKYTEMIYLVVWFAGSTATDKFCATSELTLFIVDKPEYVQVAQAELISKGLFTSSYSSYALPFEAAFTSLGRQLHEMRKLWTEVVVRVDGLDSLPYGQLSLSRDPSDKL
ncbi:hypothetical protein B0H13DRAFT_1875107 [Mycena leptocephala]|nr:hypothetical protein B0H13DRAFT_1875107 [Mycena leptocephala]